MECEISSKNAQILEKLCHMFKSEYLLIDSHQQLKFQLLTDSKNIISTILLNRCFFTKFETKNKTIQICKPKFYYTNMLFLKIKTASTFVIFEYNFELYIYRHKFFIFDGKLVQIPFVINLSDYIDQFNFFKAIEVASGCIEIVCDNESAYIYNENLNVKFRCTGLDGVHFKIDSYIMKSIFSLYDYFDSCLLNWEDKDSPVNINLYHSSYSISFFVSTI